MGKANLVLFWAIQSTALLAFVYPPTPALILLAMVSHYVRMIGITLCFHRHMAHRAFSLSRSVRFIFAWLGTSALQKGPLWWAGNHVYHHKYADREGDPHSPVVSGFFYSHMGWFTNDIQWDNVDAANPVVREFSKYPEIRWLDHYYAWPPLLLAAALFLIGGWPALVYGFCVPTFTLAHSTFAINSINHLFGSRRFNTPDNSRNNFWTTLVTLGEGWHNNHHRFQRAARNGFFWWEIDPTYWVIRALSAVGLAREIVPVPPRVYDEARTGKPRPASAVPASIEGLTA
ncbi:MAG: acyl-CoA desaturase [Vicinamibacteria bacterium]